MSEEPPDLLWPPDIKYINTYEWPESTPDSLKSKYMPDQPPTNLPTMPKVTFDHDPPSYHKPSSLEAGMHLDLPVLDLRRIPSSKIRQRTIMKRIIDPDHPAVGELGLFVRAGRQRWRRCDCFGSEKLDEEEEMDGIPKHAHILDYTGIVWTDDFADPSSDYLHKGPNACFESYVDRMTGEVRVGLFTLRHCFPDEEILVTYGNEYWESRGLHVGLIESEWVEEWEDD
ncbi:hypothetical protein BC829DRAFT_391477 [Chytridium lagenaria]|nr:hypothetical protein BC829DRAFT_391477 [Chytridium lagenaria]